MVRRHHPLEGRQLEVVRAGPKQLIVRLPEGSTMWILRSWTDADGRAADPGRPETMCARQGLLELTDLIAALQARAEEST